jgi:hypothetical protein
MAKATAGALARSWRIDIAREWLKQSAHVKAFVFVVMNDIVPKAGHRQLMEVVVSVFLSVVFDIGGRVVDRWRHGCGRWFQ